MNKHNFYFQAKQMDEIFSKQIICKNTYMEVYNFSSVKFYKTNFQFLKEMVINMSKIGENIRRKREELDLSQEELATRVGYKHKASINKIELGLNDPPQNKIIQIAEVLGTTPAVLMGWTDEETVKKNDARTSIAYQSGMD